jgi:hypothetical protein
LERQPSGRDAGHAWNLESDVKDAPLFEPFEIITQTTAWNTLQNPKEDFEGTLILIPTRKLTLIVMFPKDKLPPKDGVTTEYAPLLDDASRRPSSEGHLTVAPDFSYAKWEIDQPNLLYHYYIHWQW